MLNRFYSQPFARVLFAVVFSLLMASPLSAYQKRRGHDSIKRSGDMIQIAVPVAAAFVTLVLRDAYGLASYAGAFGTTMATSFAIKPIVNAKRPIKGGMSFPSGHTAAAMGGAAYIQMRYGMPFGLPCYLLAGYVGFSRIYAQKHWFRDVLGATAIAMAANAFFTKPLSEKYHFIPILGRDRAGICVRWEW